MIEVQRCQRTNNIVPSDSSWLLTNVNITHNLKYYLSFKLVVFNKTVNKMECKGGWTLMKKVFPVLDEHFSLVS